MDQRNPLDYLFDSSVGSGSSKLDALLGLTPITDADREERRKRYLLEDTAPSEPSAPRKAPSLTGDAKEIAAQMAPIYREFSDKYGVPYDLLMAQAQAESGFNPRAVSPAGAIGLAQFTPATAKQYGLNNPYDPVASAEAQVRYMRDLLNQFGGDETKAIAAYNAGPGNVRKAGGVPNFKETKDYLARIAGYRKQYANAPSEGMLDVSSPTSPAAQLMAPPEQQPSLMPVLLSSGETLNVEHNTTLEDVARILKDNGEDVVPMRGFSTPQGETINVPYNMGDEEILHTLRRDAPELTVPAGAPVPDYTSYTAAGKQALKQSLGQLGSGAAELARAIGAEGFAKSAEDFAAQQQKEAQGAFEMPTEEQAGFFKRKIGIPIAQGAMGMAPILPAMAVPGVGGLAVAAGAMGTQELGALKQRAEAEGKEFNLKEAAPYAAAAGAVNLLPWQRIAPLFKAASEDAVLGSREAIRAIVEKEGVDAAQQKIGSYVGEALKNAGLAEAAGASADIATSILERAYTDQNLWNKAAFDEYKDTLAQGAPFYALTGAGAGVAGRHIKATELEKIKEQKAAEEEARAQKVQALDEEEGVEVPEGAPEITKPKVPFDIPSELEGLPLRDVMNIMEAQGTLPEGARELMKKEKPYAREIQEPKPSDAGGGERPQGGEEVRYTPEGGEGVRISDQEGQGLAGEGETLKTVSKQVGEAPTHIEVEGVKRPTTDSTGAPIHTTEEGVKNFWKGFGDTKAVDDQGRPLRVYHGTPFDIAEFDPSMTKYVDGTWVTPDHAYAGSVAEARKLGGEGANVMPLYLNIKNPAIIKARDFNAETLMGAASLGKHDGIFVLNDDGSIHSALAYDKEQIKSAIGNKGAFDTSKPDIRAVTESPDIGRLPLDVTKFSQAKNARDVVDTFLQTATDENLKRKANLFKSSPHIGRVETHFVSLADELPAEIREAFEKKGAAAITSIGPDKVQIYFRNDDPASFSEDNVIHEVTHAMTEGGLQRNPELTNELNGLASTIHSAIEQDHPEAAKFWRETVKQDGSEALAYGVTSPTFREILSKYDENGNRIEPPTVQAPKTPAPRTLWDKFKDFVGRVFGIPTGRRQEFNSNVDATLDTAKAPVVKPMTTRLDRALMQAYRETSEKGITQPTKEELKAVKKATEGEQAAKEAIEKTPKLTGLAADMRKESFGGKLADTARDLFKEGRKTSFTSEWLDMYDALGKATKDRPMMVDHKAAVDMVASAYAQAGNLLTDAVHNGYIIPNGDGTYRVKKDTDVALERIYRDINSAGKAEQFNNMLVGLVARTIKAEDQKKKDTAANYAVIAEDMRAAAARTQNKTKKKSYLRTAKALEEKSEKLVELFQNQYESRTWATEEQIKQAEAIERSDPQLANEAQNVYKLLRTCVDNLEHSGIISKEFANFCRTRPNYIPLYKNMEASLEKDFDKMLYDPTNHALIDAMRSNMRSPTTKPGIKQQKRHFHEVMVEANLLKHLAMTSMMSMRNDLNRAFAEQLSVTGAAERVKHKGQADLTVMEGGAPTYYKVYDKDALFALMGAQPLINPVFRQIKKVSNLVRGVMVMNPLFWFRQVVREPLTASAVARVGMVTPFDTLKEIGKIALNKSDWYENLKRRGIVAAQDAITDPAEFAKYVGKEKGWTAKGVDQIKKIHEAVDGATRAVVAEKAYKQAISEGFSHEDAENIAAIKAREIINFARQGRSDLVRSMRAVTPFFGAALNGLHVAAKAMAPEKIGNLSKAEAMEQRRTFYTRASLIALYTSAYAMAMSDDEDYLKSADRGANWFIPTGNKDEPFVKIPIPFELGALVKTIPEAIALANMGAISTQRAVKEVGKTVWDTVVPPFPMIYAIKPMVEAVINFDFHNWTPIESRGDSEKLSYLRSRRASELMKEFGKELHKVGMDAEVLSPDRMEHMMEGYFGQLWGITRAASDYVLYNGPERPEKMLSDMPLLKGAIVKGTKDRAVEDFYDVYDDIKKFAATESSARNRGNYMLMEELKKDPKFVQFMRAKEPLKEIMDAMNEKSANIETVTNKRDLDARVKAQRIKTLETERNTLADRGVRLARRLGFEI